MAEWFLRFFIGGCAVSAFALVGALLRPKSFAGLFGAAPSVALATLFLTFAKEGSSYAALEGEAMILGGAALAFYVFVVCQVLARLRVSALLATTAALPVWFIAAFGLKSILLG